jgi:NIPSNAP
MRALAVRSFVIAFVALAVSPFLAAQGSNAQNGRIVEIRSYNLKPGTRDTFHQLAERDAVPMLKRWKIDVVAYGPSLHDANSYFLIRSFASVEDRQRSEDAFYGSEEWKTGPRDAVLACIASYTTVVVRLDDAALKGLRGAGR